MGFIWNKLLGLSFLLTVFSTKVCSSSSSSHEYCPPSSCGTIRNISYPFRLKDHHPNNCTKPGFLELTCENNNVTTVYLNSKRFIVKSITYHNFTIRLLDPGFHQDYHHLGRYSSSTSCPLHFLTYPEFEYYSSSSGDYFTLYDDEDYDGSYINLWLTYISCSSYININTTTTKSNENNEYHYYDGHYYEAPGTTACGFDSHFPAENYSYIVYAPLPIRDLKISCRPKGAAMVSKKAPAAPKDGLVGNYTQLLPDYTYGFELLWNRILCETKCYARGYGCYADKKTGTADCFKVHCFFSLSRRGLSTLHSVNCLKQYLDGSDDDDPNKIAVAMVSMPFERNKLHNKYSQCFETLNPLRFSLSTFAMT